MPSNKKILIVSAIISVFAAYFFIMHKGGSFNFAQKDGNEEKMLANVTDLSSASLNSITGVECGNNNKRPFAVMIAGDYNARPISGISQADLVIEMPVITGSITRFLAFFGCGEPEEIGPIRSARHDFLPLVSSFDAVFVHWGGSHFALDELKKGYVDNIDARPNFFSTFYRKRSLKAPNNGFTSFKALENASEKLGYSRESKFSGYKHITGINFSLRKSIISIGYSGPYKVEYIYNPIIGKYLRYKGNREEIDSNNGKQVLADVVIVMRAYSEQIEGDYNDVALEGKGKAIVYMAGHAFNGSWQKDGANPGSKLLFYDSLGREIKFVPGNIWIEIVEPYQTVKWKTVE